jgi:hypothetical protein
MLWANLWRLGLVAVAAASAIHQSPTARSLDALADHAGEARVSVVVASPATGRGLPASSSVPVPVLPLAVLAGANGVPLPAWAAAMAAAPLVVHVAPSGTDNSTCGLSEQAPCASLAFAVNAIANAQLPLAATVSVVVAQGTYPANSCGAVATRPLAITGAGSGTSMFSCGGTGRWLLTNSSIAVTGVRVEGCLTTLVGEDDSSARCCQQCQDACVS